ncbi:MAG: hypothetical protein ABR867_02150 [Nitrososphaerales archaeon]
MIAMNPFKRAVNKIREINRRYAKPRIRLSRSTRLALLALRLYLIVLVILLAYKFSTIV